MDRKYVKPLSWLLGATFLAVIIAFFQPHDFLSTVASVGVEGIAYWVFLTLIARIVLAETTVAPLEVLGFKLRRADAFWIGWIRTFANQILPLAGIAAYAHAVRDRVSISWSELASLATPQLILAATALGLVGLTSVSLNIKELGLLAVPMTAAYFLMVLVSLAVATGAGWLLESLPKQFSLRAEKTVTALRQLAQRRNFIPKLVIYHAVVILLRGCRIWILFVAAGVDIDWREMLLVVAIAESTILIQLTPGGLGLREGAILGGASLVGVAAPVAVSVALIDRILVMSITSLLAIPAFGMYRNRRSE